MTVRMIPDHPEDPEKVTYSDGTYTAEISTMQWDRAPDEIHYKGQIFTLISAKITNGDIAGWRYNSTTSGDQFLLIND